LSMLPRPLTPTLFPYTTLFRSQPLEVPVAAGDVQHNRGARRVDLGAVLRERHAVAPADADLERILARDLPLPPRPRDVAVPILRSEEHTSELQSQSNLVCRLLL